MAYADQQMSGNRITALIIVALIHILLVYALVTGLAYSGMIAVVKRVTTVDITDEPEKEPPPPPKTKVLPPPIVVPPPRINVNVAPRQIDAIPSFSPQPVQTVQPTFTPTPTPTPTPTEAPGPRVQPRAAAPRGNPGSWATTNDYPSRALREERAGTTGFRRLGLMAAPRAARSPVPAGMAIWMKRPVPTSCGAPDSPRPPMAKASRPRAAIPAASAG
jgi:periplasmic protein TonB